MRETLFASSVYKQKYFFNAKFNGLPPQIQEELRVLIIPLCQKIHGIIEVGFYKDDGEVFIETSCNDGDYRYDEIGAKLEIDRLLREQKEFFKQLELWYKIKILKIINVEDLEV